MAEACCSAAVPDMYSSILRPKNVSHVKTALGFPSAVGREVQPLYGTICLECLSSPNFFFSSLWETRS